MILSRRKPSQVHMSPVKIIDFPRDEKGLHAYELRRVENEVTLLQTVADNMLGFSKREVKRAIRARKLIQTMMYPSIEDARKAIQMGAIKNCPVTLKDIANMKAIFGKDPAALKGKTRRQKPKPYVSDLVTIPRALKKVTKNIELSVDILYIQGVIFFLGVAHKILYLHGERIADRKPATILDAFDSIFRLFNYHGFVVRKINADPEFKFAEQEMIDIDIEMNFVAAQEHVSLIERNIQFGKERYRCLYHSLPYNNIPILMIEKGFEQCVKWINSFPRKTGISDTYSPNALLTQQGVDYNKDCLLSFGSYVQAANNNNPTNTPKPRTIGCIFLGMKAGDSRVCQLMNLTTGKPITRHHVDEVPITQEIIDRVEALAEKDGIKPDLVFRDRKGAILVDDQIAGVDDDVAEPLSDDEDEDTAVEHAEDDRSG